MKLITPPGMLVTVALLAIYAAYAGLTAYVERSWVYAVAAAVAIVACVGTAMLRRWSRFLVYLLAVAFIGGWMYSLYLAQRVGYFSLYSRSQLVVFLAPGILLILLSCACAYIVFRYFRTERAREIPG